MGFSGEFDRIARNEARSAAARNIFNEVEDWRGTRRAIASKRWIWELLQNAKDAAKGRPFSFSIALKQNALTVQHDAGPFYLRDNHAPYLFSFIPELKSITFDLPDREHLVFTRFSATAPG